MKKLTVGVVVVIGVVLGVVLLSVPTTTSTNTSNTNTNNTVLQQPQREPYVAPQWVINERGQRCIQQGTTVTCG